MSRPAGKRGPSAETGSRLESAARRVPGISARIIAAYAAILLLWSIFHGLRRAIRPVRDHIDDYYFGAPDTSVVWALVLLLLAAALATRKRVAWRLLTGYLLLYTLLNVAEIATRGAGTVLTRDDASVSVTAAAIALAVHVIALGILLVARRAFHTRVRPGATWQALGTLMGLLLVGTMLCWGLVEAFPGTLPHGQRFTWTLSRVTGFAGASARDGLLFDGTTHGWIRALAGVFGAAAVLAAFFVLLRSQGADNAMTGYDESAIRGLLASSDHQDSLGYFATRRDKAVVFAPDGSSAITYRVEAGVCLASGDPLGDVARWPAAIDEWLALCDRFGWEPAVMGAGHEATAAFAASGLSVVHLGDEAIVEAAHLRSTTAPVLRGVRQAVSRTRRAGITVRIRRHRDVPADEMAAAIGLAEQWRGAEAERGFSMALGRMGDPLDGECLLVEAFEKGGRPVGLLSFVPWGTAGASLDVMRRSRQAPNGVIELMVVETAAAADRFGIRRLSLNFAVMRSVFEEGAQLGAGPVLRMWRSLLLFFSRWWQLESLYRSNAKYDPQWVPRYLCYTDRRNLPRVGYASALAEGFVTLPWDRHHEEALEHTGTESAVPRTVLAAGTLHADGTRPDTPPSPTVPRVHRPDQVRVRLRKLDALAGTGVDPYPVAMPPTHTAVQARATPTGTRVAVSGRILRMRDLGGVAFAVLRDWTGDVQVLVDADAVGRDAVRDFARFDLGDLIQVRGRRGVSRSGEPSLLARQWRIEAKSLHPLPDKWRGLTDPEARVRQRHIDLAVNTGARALLTARSAIVRSLRDSLAGEGFLEVETPILQRVHGGANAAPFVTHINAYDLDLYLRIAPELYLKRLCVAGVDRVFEIGRVFRNEGVDFKHNPEFTILEAYEAHGDHLRMMELSRRMIQAAARAAHGGEVIVRTGADGARELIDISGEWPVRTVHDAVSEALGERITPATPVDRLRRLCDERGIAFRPDWDAGAVTQELYEHLVEGRTGFPTFYTDFPTSVSPLTRPNPEDPAVAAKWDLVAWGVELGTAYSELTDPVEQRRRLTSQSLAAAAGDDEAMELDEDFLQALESGMPPTGGLGLGVDRIVMLITGASIRESLAFPLVKPRDGD